MSWHWVLIALLAGWGLGYLTKDQLTDEYVSNVTTGKMKVKGQGNSLDADQVTTVHMRRMSRKEKREARREARKQARENNS